MEAAAATAAWGAPPPAHMPPPSVLCAAANAAAVAPPPAHMLPQGSALQAAAADKAKKATLPTMPHMSSVSFLAACNCGRKQANRDDPFTLKDANHTFYAEMEEDCCRDLEKVITHLELAPFNFNFSCPRDSMAVLLSLLST